MLVVLTAIFSGSCLVGDRRRGFLDLVFVTPLRPREIIDGTLLSVWEHVRRTYWLPWALGFFFCLTGSSWPIGVCCSIITATLFCALLSVHGTACSLTAKTLPVALVCTFLFPLLMSLGIVFFIPIFRVASGPMLWLCSALFFIVTWNWVRRRTSTVAVACHFMAVHLVLACLATCWTWSGHPNREEYPISVMNPPYMIVRPLENHSQEWFRELRGRQFEPLLCYWSVLVVNFFWARWWLIRNFERLIDRPGKPKPSRARPRKRIKQVQSESVGVAAED
jgi:hypothetical protein